MVHVRGAYTHEIAKNIMEKCKLVYWKKSEQMSSELTAATLIYKQTS